MVAIMTAEYQNTIHAFSSKEKVAGFFSNFIPHSSFKSHGIKAHQADKINA